MNVPAEAVDVVPLGSQGLRVSALGLGCMELSGMYLTPDPVESVATFEYALERGVTFLDTANSYSLGANETLVGSLIGTRRDQVTLATKFGLGRDAEGVLRVHSDPAHIVRSIDESLARLRTDHVDLYYAHRLNPAVPVEETVGAMADLVHLGKVRFLGLCEVSEDELRRAHRVHPISAIQSEWSLFARGFESECLATARSLGVGIVPFSPLGRGFLAGAIPSPQSFAATDVRSADPRFSEKNLAVNLPLLAVVEDVARRTNASKAQVALAWLKAQGHDVVPIPGTERREFLRDNIRALSVSIGDEDLDLLDRTFVDGAIAGNADEISLRFRKLPKEGTPS